jgi:ribosomal protein L32
MAKTATRKKPTQTKTEKRLAGDKKKKLPRGYKECGNCKMLLNIHKYVCN